MKRYFSILLVLLFSGFIIGHCTEVEAVEISNYISSVSDIKVNDNIKIVGLGEATHGNSEMQKLKLEVFKSLVKNNNCHVFAIEGDFGGCAKVNEYIMGGDGNAEEAASEIGFGVYKTKEIEDLIEWMRQYNKNAKDTEKLKFYGFDMQRYDNNKEFLFSYLDKVDKDLSKKYKDLLKDLNDDTVYHQDNSKVKECSKYIDELTKIMIKNKDVFIGKTSEKEFEFAYQCANSIKENAALRTAGLNYSNLRDEYMKNKVDWIYNFEGQKLIFINGHNGHIEKTSSSSGIQMCMGQRLSESYKNLYYAIGTDFIESTFNVTTSFGEKQVINLRNTNPLSSQFENLKENIYFMDINKCEENNELNKIVNSSINMNNINEVFNSWDKINKFFYTAKMVPAKAYDGIIVINKDTPSNKFN